MSTPSLSIIIPVYNVEKYLDECIESVLRQTFTDYELLLVDDGSKDKSGEICDKYAEKHPHRIKVFHKPNGGASTARNLGLDNASGHYIGFIDSDDVIHPQMFEKLVEAIRLHDVDIVSSQISCETGHKGVLTYNTTEWKGSNLELLGRLYTWEENCSVDTKIFKRELIGDTRYVEGVINEDFIFLSEIFLKPGRAYVIPEAYYFYRTTQGSVTRTLKEKYFDIFINLDYVEKLLPPDNREIHEKFRTYSMTMHIMSGVNIVKKRANGRFKNWLRTHRRYIRRNFGLIAGPSPLSLRWRAKALFTFLRLP